MVYIKTIKPVSAISRWRPLEWLNPALPLPEYYAKLAFRLSPVWQLGIALLLNILSLALPILMLHVYDRIIPHHSYGTLIVLLAGVLTALAMDASLRLARAYLIGWTAASNEHAASCAAINQLANSKLTAFEATGAGTHLQNLSAIGKLREFFSGQALTALVDLPFVAIFLGLIAYLGGILVFVPLTILTVFLLLSRSMGTTLRHALESRNVTDDRKNSFIISVLTGIHSVKSLAMETLLMRRFEERQTAVTQSSYHVAQASGNTANLSAAVGQLSLILTATAGCLLVLNGELTIGGLSACSLLAGRALQPVQRVLGTWLRLQDYSIAQHQAETILNIPTHSRNLAILPDPEGIVTLRNATYTPDGETSPRLKNISLDIKAGEVIAISGEKGSGRAALLQLIAGILTPTDGTVRIDGIDPALYGLSSLQKHIGYLPPNGTMFKGSILENLTGFRMENENIAIAKEIGKQLGLDKVVNLLPKGYLTQLNDNNADPIAPGVKQRIALVRVLRHFPTLLLFNDADRTLDKEGYNLLFRMMGKLKGRSTIILVSHDQNLLSFADRFYLLENGYLLKDAPNEGEHLSHLIHFSPERRK